MVACTLFFSWKQTKERERETTLLKYAYTHSEQYCTYFVLGQIARAHLVVSAVAFFFLLAPKFCFIPQNLFAAIDDRSMDFGGRTKDAFSGL